MNNEYLRHRKGVAELTERLIRFKKPDMKENKLFMWYMTGFLHDIGKEVINKWHPGLLEKPASLTGAERAIVRTHTKIGYERLKESKIQEISCAAFAALEHHERWNGSGYMGIRGAEISLSGRIVAIADVYDALCHDRSYRKAWNKEIALDYMINNSGILFDPEWIEALLAIESYKTSEE